MEITVLEFVAFIVSFVFLFFVTGFVLTKKKDIEERLAHSFVISSAILFIGSLILSKTIGLTWITLVGFVIVVTAISVYRSANL